MATAAQGPQGNTIFLSPPERLGENYREFRATGTVYPGYLLQPDGVVTSGTTFPPDMRKVKAHSVRNGKSNRLIAIEDATLGNTVETSMASGELVRAVQAEKGDLVNLVLKAGQNIAQDDYLVSNGDGTVIKAASEILANIVADSTASPAGVAEAAFDNSSVVLPKNTLSVGDIIRVRAAVYVSNQNSTDTLTVRLKLGTTTIVTTGALDVATGDQAIIDAMLTIRTIGAGGTYVASGIMTIGVPGTVTVKEFTLVSTAIDTTADNTMTVTYQWSASSANNQAVLRQYLVEEINGTGTVVGDGIDYVAQAEEATDLSLEVVNGWVAARLL